MPTSNDLTDLESQVKKSKISASNFKRQGLVGSSDQIINIHKTIGNLAGHVRKTVIRVNSLEKIVDNQSRKITSLKNISKTQSERISGTNIGSKLPGGSADSLNKTISTIADTVSSIVETLKLQRKTTDAISENERKKAEREKRGLAESKLEKAFGGIINAAQKIIAPVKSIIDRILDFIKTVILGRIVYKLIGWLGDPKNTSKVKSIIRFVKDWWPTLLSAYIIFGTSFGRFTTKIIGMVARFAIQIATKAIPGLITLARRNPATAALAIGTTTYLTNQALNPSIQANQERQGFSGGGHARPAYRRGSLGRFFGLYGGGSPGYVSGAKGVDRIPAMLSDGEFVMSRGAVQMYGADTLASMNAAGGGTNRPKVIGGTTYAQGGGPMGNMPNPDPSYKDKDNRINLIKELEKYARSQASSGGNGNIIKSLNDLALSLKGQGAGRNFGSDRSNRSSSSNPLETLRRQVNDYALRLKSGKSGSSRTSSENPLETLRRRVNDYALNLKNGKPSSTPTQTKPSGPNPFTSAIGKFIGNIADNPYLGETAAIERERSLGLMKPGAAPLTKETQERLKRNDDWIKSLYDPTKHKGVGGNIRKAFQDIQDKGFFADPFSLLKTEGFEKGVEKLSRGRVKNFGASVQGVQMSLKALAGPLGRMFRVEDQGAMGRYLRPAMMEAQRRGHGDVGRVGLTGKIYDKLLTNKIANFALGQTSFKVDRSGRAMTGITGTSRDETWDFNQTAEKNFAQSRKALKTLGDVLQGKQAFIGEGENAKRATIANTAFETLFKGMSGVYRTLQNTAYGNLRPMGSNIDLGGGFKPTDANGKVLSPQQISAERAKFTKPKPKTLPVKPPVKSTTVMQGQSAVTMYSKNDPRRKNSGPTTPRFSARPSSSSKHKILGITLPF